MSRYGDGRERVRIVAQGDDGFQYHVTALEGTGVGLLQENGSDQAEDGGLVE